MIDIWLKTLLENAGIGSLGLSGIIIIGFAIYLYFDTKYKRLLEINHFNSINKRLDFIEDNMLEAKVFNDFKDYMETQTKATWARIDEHKSYFSEMRSELVRYSERTDNQQKEIDRIRNRYNGVK